jgi:S-formylglutathione hydrolase FrmB
MADTIETERGTYIHIDYLTAANNSAERRGRQRDDAIKALRGLLIAVSGIREYEDGTHYPDNWDDAIAQAKAALDIDKT